MAISDANKLLIYNGALRFIGGRKLSALTDNIESRRLLDDVWNEGGINKVLRHGQWNFAMRTQQLDYSPSVTPAFGHNRAFEKPTDMIRLCGVYSDGYLQCPFLEYQDAPTWFFASIDTIYVQYVSNDDSYGTDYSLWPPDFDEYVKAWFGCEIIGKLTQNETKEANKKDELKKLLLKSQSQDSMNDPTKFLPQGNFRKSRRGGKSYDSLWNGEYR